MHEIVFTHDVCDIAVSYDAPARVARDEHQAQLDESYKNGYEAASSQYNQQILDFRSEINALQEGSFSQLESKFLTVVGEAREALITLTMECVAEALGGYEMPAEAIEKIVTSVIAEADLDDERLAVHLHSADLALLEDIDAEMKAKHPGLEWVADDSLKRGDCLLNSRFGKIDGRMANKLQKLQESLRPS